MNVFSLLDQLPVKAKAILLGAAALAVASTPACIAVIVANSGSLVYKTADTEINLKGKELTSINAENLQKLQEQIQAQNIAILELTLKAKEKKIDRQLKPQIRELETGAIESSVRLQDVQDSQEDLTEFVIEQSQP